MNIYIKYLLKGIFLFAIIYLINILLFSDGNLQKLQSIKKQLNSTTYLIITIVFLLQFINWGIEARKFQFIISKKEKVSFKQSIIAVYTGNATGIFTPDRLGNFIGRFIYLNQIDKTTVTASTLLGNLAQLISTISFALIAVLLYIELDLKIQLPYINPVIILGVLIIALSILIYLFFNPNKIIKKFNKIKWIAKHKTTFNFLENFNKTESATIIGLSLLRYLIFIIQFYLILNTFELSINLIETLVFSGLLYLFTTFIPSPIMGNLGTREVVALLLLNNYDHSEIALVASLIIWIINVIFPSLIGSYLLLKMNPSKK